LIDPEERFRYRRPMDKMERRFVRYCAKHPEALALEQRNIVRYAISLARTGLLRVPAGHDIDLTDVLGSYRGWLLDLLAEPIKRNRVDPEGIAASLPAILAHAGRARGLALEHYADNLDPEVLDTEVCHKALVLALGGGGGSGFAHLGAFAMLQSLDWVPDLIVGSSMGSLMGLFRCLSQDWDVVGTILSIPRRFDRDTIFTPFAGFSRYGLPGAFTMELGEISQDIFDLLTDGKVPTLDELPIRLEVVVTGVRTGIRSALNGQMEDGGKLSSLTGLGLRRRLVGLVNVFRTLVSNQAMLAEVIFGRDAGTGKCKAIDAIGFSCAVPGLFCYDLGDDAFPDSVDALDALFDEKGLWGLTDGGVVNNVPARVAWESVHAGTIGTHNAFIYSLDAFAPQVNSNVLFLPIQQAAAWSVASNAKYSDLHHSYSSPPSPLDLAPGWTRLSQVIEESRAELERDRAFIEDMQRPLPQFEQLDITLA
jgi:predicted acylesterase/phospholipase RssA